MTSVLVIGVGPGIGTAVAARFGREGMPVGLVARSPATLDAARARLADEGINRVTTVAADAADEDALRAALDRLVAELGVPGVVVYNAAIVGFDSIFDLSHTERQARYAVNVLGALTTVTHLAPQLVEAGGGTILITAGMPEPDARLMSLSIDKAGLRAAIAAIAGGYRAQGVHISTVTIGGIVAPGTRYDPAEIAEQYWALHSQSISDWSPDLTYWGPPTPH